MLVYVVVVFLGVALVIWMWHQHRRRVQYEQHRLWQYNEAMARQLRLEYQHVHDSRHREATQRAKNEFLTRMERAVTDGALVDLGDCYLHGVYPLFRPNHALAMRCYAAAGPDGAVKLAAGLVDRAVADDDAADGDPIPVGYAEAALRHGSTTTPRRPLPQLLAHPPRVIARDDQNVHDHAITAGLRTRRGTLDIVSADDEVLERVRHEILETPDVSELDKMSALDVLETLSTRQHSGLKCSERDALATVWTAIGENANAKETLVKQLASGVENGHVVCSTGKIARILGTLDGISGEPLRPVWAIREELGRLGASIRDAGGDADSFASRARQTYVDDLGMHEDVVMPLIDEYRLGFA